MANYEMFQIEITKNYTKNEWRDDLKKVIFCLIKLFFTLFFYIQFLSFSIIQLCIRQDAIFVYFQHLLTSRPQNMHCQIHLYQHLMFQVLIKSGIDGKRTVFLFSDNQIKEESFVEDINMILNTGDVPNIFAADEKADVIEKMQGVARLEVVASDWISHLLYVSLISGILHCMNPQ